MIHIFLANENETALINKISNEQTIFEISVLFLVSDAIRFF